MVAHGVCHANRVGQFTSPGGAKEKTLSPRSFAALRPFSLFSHFPRLMPWATAYRHGMAEIPLS